MIPRCPGASEYGRGMHRTKVHVGCCVQVLGYDLLRRGDRYVLALDDGAQCTEFVVAPADELICASHADECGWHAWLSTRDRVVAVGHGAAASQAAQDLDRQLRALERLAAAVGAHP